MAPKTSGRGGPRGAGCCGGDRRRGDRRRERARNENGQFADSIDPADVLSVFDAVEGPVVTSTDVADVLGISTESARQHLNEQVGEGTLRRRKTGRTIVYWQVTTNKGEGDE
ncbi:helix-turn-helix domain-containing protein [Halorhabdus amylolytica]|uniref:hypothetical protein n=1 Tax=Halorhabdus amylolytica TaxID=2559573 RepID=UPI001B7D7CAC|nr:hypothetical protein [Halorhabdus amylolytica]